MTPKQIGAAVRKARGQRSVREVAGAAIMAEYAQMNPVAHASGSTPNSMWIWAIKEEIA